MLVALTPGGGTLVFRELGGGGKKPVKPPVFVLGFGSDPRLSPLPVFCVILKLEIKCTLLEITCTLLHIKMKIHCTEIDCTMFNN